MFIFASGLPPKTDFDFFVIQVPTAPFGLAWYQGDVQTDEEGNAFQHFRGRFSVETFSFAQGPAPAPDTFPDGPFPDATVNPSTNPIQMYHLGLWFNSPNDAQTARCPATVTAFNGEHTAGLQVLNTSNFPELQGPLLIRSPCSAQPEGTGQSASGAWCEIQCIRHRTLCSAPSADRKSLAAYVKNSEPSRICGFCAKDHGSH